MKNTKTAGFAPVLKNPEFMKLWIGQIVSYVGDRVMQMALLGWLIASGQKTGSEMAKITFFNMLPAFLLGHAAGGFADRVPRRALMILTDLFRAALVLTMAVFLSGGNRSLALVYGLVFVAGIFTAFFYPAKLSIIPSLVRSEELQAANALSSVTGMVATLIGTYFAGILIQHYGTSTGFFINGGTYLVSALAIFWIRVPKASVGAGTLSLTPLSPNQQEKLDFFRDFKAISFYLKTHRKTFALIGLSTFLSFLSSFFYIALTVLAVDHFKIGTEGVGKLLTMLGVGMMTGAMASVSLRKWFRPLELLIGSFGVIFITTATAEWVQSYAFAWVWLGFLGAANGIVMVTVDTLLQRISPDRFRGKIFGVRSVLTNGVFLISLLGVSQLLRLFSPFAVFKVLAFTSLFIAVLILLIERNFAHLILRLISRTVMKILFSLEVEGEDHLRYRSKVILAGNHTGFLDSPILIAAARRPICFLVARAVFSWPLVGWFVKHSGVIPVTPGRGQEAIDQAVEILKRGQVVGIFPEGKLSRDGRIGRFHRGVAKLHLESKAPVVPFVIHGGFEAWHWGQAFPKFRRVVIQFGQPIESFDGGEEALVEEIRDRVEFMKEALSRRERARAEEVYMESVLSLMQMKSDVYGARPALMLKEKNSWNELSYIELSRQAKEFSNFLIKKGIKRGDRIAILSESRPEWGIAFFASIRAGAVTVPLDIKLTSAELVSILSNALPRVLLVSEEFAETAKALKTLLPAIEYVILLSPDESHPELPYFRNLQAAQEIEGRERDIDETALIIYTSGTTGNPKGVMTSFRNLIFQIRSFESLMRLNRQDTFLSILPLNHLLELTGGFLGVLHAGGRICYSPSLNPQEVSRIMRERQITYMITVPLFLKVFKSGIEKQIRRMEGVQRHLFKMFWNLASWIPSRRIRKTLFYPIHREFGGRLRGFISGGAPLEKEVGEFFERIGIPVYQGYGLTETSPVISVNAPGANRYGSVGRPLSGVAVKITKSEAGDEGEILTKGPHVMKGYYQNEDLTAEVIDDGKWFHTGDLGRLDKDGFLYITGRIKNLIVLPGGKKVHPEEVEACLAESALFKEVCVLGKKAESGKKEGGEEVTLVIVPSDDAWKKSKDSALLQKAMESEVSRLAQNLAQYKRPAKIHIYPEDFPKTATRKIKRPLVLQWIQTGLTIKAEQEKN